MDLVSKQDKNITYTKYQQGDVVMYKVDNNFDKFTSSNENQSSYSGKTNTKAILAFGEVTGHTHRIEMKDMLEEAGITLHMNSHHSAGKDVPKSFSVKGTNVTLIHEEHDDVVLPPGNYVIRIVQEFNHITRRAQYVAD